MKDLHIKLERMTLERAESIDKYTESERYWRQKKAKQEREHHQLFEINQSLKDDNSALLTQLDKFNKRIKQLENEA